MKTRLTIPGFTIFELLIVVLVVAVLAVLLFPIPHGCREKPRQTQCTSNLRQMATALQMYAQDNKGNYMGMDWGMQMQNNGVAEKMFMCPSSTAKEGQNAYAYNSLLIRPDGTGVNETQVIAPTEVGAICDADPISDHTGLIGGGVAGKSGYRIATPASRHSNGVIVGFCDGHAKYLPGAYKDNIRDLNNPVLRAMYMPVNLGALDSVGGAVNTLPRTTDAATYRIGGDPCTEALIKTAVYAYASSCKATIKTRGFLGQYNRTGRTGNYLWGGGDGKAKGHRIIGHDALLVVVNKNSKISSIVQKANLYPPAGTGIRASDQTNIVTPAQVYRLFTTGYVRDSLTCYTYDANNGSRAFFREKFGDGRPISKSAVTVYNDYEMMEAVAKDPYGIGYLSSALVDLDRVKVLALHTVQGDFCYPSGNVRTRWQLPDTLKGWPTYRDLYVAAGPGAAKPLALFTPGHAFLRNPLYRLGFERP